MGRSRRGKFPVGVGVGVGDLVQVHLRDGVEVSLWVEVLTVPVGRSTEWRGKLRGDVVRLKGREVLGGDGDGW